MRTFVALLFVLAVAYAAELLAGDSPTAIPGSYIIVMKDGVDRDAHVTELMANVRAAGDDHSVILNKYDIGTFVAFAANLSATMLKTELAHPDVDYVEVDQIVKSYAYSTQKGATWGLDRIDQRALPLGTSYYYNTTAGSGVDVYVIDTGIYDKNADFGGRAKHGHNSISGESNTDLNGHGTHCAGTVGGSLYGVAKKVSLIAVKVLNEEGSGTNTGVIAGIQYVTNERSKHSRPMVASMSLGGGASSALDAAVVNSIAAGITYVVAAGNENSDACLSSPARVPAAITVGATDDTDRRASYSNWGKCVDIFAPGSDIDSDWIGSTNAHTVISGTSMATPHVSGVVAMYLSHHGSKTPAQVVSYLTSVATAGVVKSPGSASPNLLLYAQYA